MFPFARHGHALFKVAHAGEILVEPVAIACGAVALEFLRLASDGVPSPGEADLDGTQVLFLVDVALADYEGLRQGFPVTFVTTVPSLLQRQGNFSQTVTSVNGVIQPITIYDPLQVETLANGQRQRTAFTGNAIPSNRIDPVSRKLADLFPEPNQPGNAVGQNNYVRSAGSTINTDKWDARVDHTFGENTRLFGRYSQQKDVRLVPGPLPPPLGGGRNTTDTYHQAMADLTHVFGPTWLLSAQFTFSRALATQFGLSRG